MAQYRHRQSTGLVVDAVQFEGGDRPEGVNTPVEDYELKIGDWIVTNSTGQKNICSSESFADTYEAIESP